MPAKKLLADPRVDWDVVFCTFNSRLDKAEEAWRKPTLLRGREALKELGGGQRRSRESGQ